MRFLNAVLAIVCGVGVFFAVLVGGAIAFPNHWHSHESMKADFLISDAQADADGIGEADEDPVPSESAEDEDIEELKPGVVELLPEVSEESIEESSKFPSDGPGPTMTEEERRNFDFTYPDLRAKVQDVSLDGTRWRFVKSYDSEETVACLGRHFLDTRDFVLYGAELEFRGASVTMTQPDDDEIGYAGFRPDREIPGLYKLYYDPVFSSVLSNSTHVGVVDGNLIAFPEEGFPPYVFERVS